MLALNTPILSALFFLCTVQVSVTSVNCAKWNQRRTSSIAASSEPLRELCIPFSQEAVASANLTDAEQSILPELCYRPDLALFLFGTEGDRGIPIGVECTPFQWCDSYDHCTTVCKRGSVVVNPSLQKAIATQLELSRRLPLCYASLIGTHNSGISLADGYGNLDSTYQHYFRWISWLASDAYLQTNNQYLSLTDQMNLGVRIVELDTHFFDGDLRIAHCGGFHSALDRLVTALNVLAKLLHHPIQWDSETIGCQPSLSSIPAAEQRTLLTAMQELADWLALPQNQQEFLIVFFDDQMDLAAWDMVPALLNLTQSVFPLETIFTPPELVLIGGVWPSMDELVARGKRVMFVSGADYGLAMNTVIFTKDGTVCGWREPPLRHFVGEPICSVETNGTFPADGATLSGELYRVTTCELQYGPMNCDFVWGATNEPLLDEVSLPEVTRCGLNSPSPDSLTPERAAAMIWTWADGHPYDPYLDLSQAAQLWSMLQDVLRAAFGGTDTKAECGAISTQDGRWRALKCSRGIPTACRGPAGEWQLATGLRGSCPPGYLWQVPHHAKENMQLQMLLKSTAGPPVEAAWLPIQGPDWNITWPLSAA
ncbi:hypothetical protein ABBQ38_004267 [Trebouxia sp. C0009 RCD-2024]